MLSTRHSSREGERNGGFVSYLATIAVVNCFWWEVLPSGPGYTVRRVQCCFAFRFDYGVLNGTTQPKSGKPEQYCMMIDGLGNGTSISVSAFPVPWRADVVNDERYRGYDYVR